MGVSRKPPRPYIIKAVSTLHALVYRLTQGRVGGRLGSLPILLLTTRGRKSRRRRTTPLVYLRDGQDLVIIASYGGRDQQPAGSGTLRATIRRRSRSTDGLQGSPPARRPARTRAALAEGVAPVARLR
ncbi:MAG: DUF385 domain-containing protein [Dehalococcoidia bacterium]|nr:DUF385 domain-containing protein [Dehalococcoidia bacterium]